MSKSKAKNGGATRIAPRPVPPFHAGVLPRWVRRRWPQLYEALGSFSQLLNPDGCWDPVGCDLEPPVRLVLRFKDAKTAAAKVQELRPLLLECSVHPAEPNSLILTPKG